MAAHFMLPDRGLILRPAVIEDVTVPEIYADGALVRAGREINHIILYRTLGGAHRQVASVPMARTGFDRSFVLAAVEWEPMPGWPGYLTMQ